MKGAHTLAKWKTHLAAIKAALAELSEPELHALIDATKGAPQVAPGLLAWIEAACDWELNGRLGLDYPLQPPEAAFRPEEDANSIDAPIAMRATLAKHSAAVRALFDALVELLTGGERKD